MKVIGYLRVSTEEQQLGLRAQEDACREYAKKMGYEIHAFFQDEICGAVNLEDRDGLMTALGLLKKEDILLVAKRDRLARDKNFIAMIEMTVKKKKAKIISAAGEGTESEDENDIASFILRSVTDMFAQVERLLIKSRTKAALQAKKARGERVGHIPFGYKLAVDGIHIETCELEQNILKQIKDLRAEGFSIRAIAEEMNYREAFNRGESLWNHASVHRILKAAA